MNVISWGHQSNRIDIFYVAPTDMSNFNSNLEWDLISITARKSTDKGGWSTAADHAIVSYDIIIQRKPIYYLLTFVLPCFITATIGIIGIFAPFDDAGFRQEKADLGLTTLLNMTVILTLIADKMPKSSEGLPLL
uniref:Neurotransmitter-gated ion-channel transmembrane domain-containing protein n=1 Tax=Plectus sambesii TaxID=2011161 RepID=A0A914UU31_9BILA